MWSDRIETRLHACSLEVCGQAILIGCYELLKPDLADSDSETYSPESQPSRNGELILYRTEKSYEHGHPHFRFSKPLQTIEADGGILDGKFLQGLDHPKIYCSASSSGLLTMFDLQGHDAATLHLTKLSTFGDTNVGLCLSLGWDNYTMKDICGSVSTRIVSSYSEGTLAIFNIVINNHEKKVEALTEEVHRWNAHTLFGRPCEVWSTCFATNSLYNTYGNIVISGADDCKLKLWDVRSTIRPVHDIHTTEAGVTAVSYHPSLEHVFASGSYDESVSVWDMRKLDSRAPIQKVETVGGGVWRIKWNPCDASSILVGAMHGGARILNISCLQSSSQDDDAYTSAPISFTAHQSMTYGADWIYCADCNIQAAATCSFYDRQGFIWSAKYEGL